MTRNPTAAPIDNRSNPRVLFTSLTVLLLLTSNLLSADSSDERTLLSKIQALHTPSLEGEVEVYYSLGYAERAANFQSIVREATHFFSGAEGVELTVPLSVAVLDPDDFRAIEGRPYGVYGIPFMWHPPGEPSVALVPATPESPIVSSILSLEDRLSTQTLERLTDLGLTFPEAAAKFADLLILHEVGHAFASAYTTYLPQRWLNEFMATYLAYAFLQQVRPQEALVWSLVNDALVETSEHSHTSLADFDRLYIQVGLENYGWYQGKFQQKAAELVETSGLQFIHAFREAWLAAPDASVSDPLRLLQLTTIHDGFGRWAGGEEGELADSDQPESLASRTETSPDDH